MVAKQVANLLDDMSSASGGRVQVMIEGGMSAETAAPINAVRLAVTECLMPAVAGERPVTVRVAGLPSPRIQINPATAPGLSPEVEAALAAAGIQIGTDGHGISISLPGPPELPH